MADLGVPKIALELAGEGEIAVPVLIGRYRRFEIARVGEAVGADGAQIGQA